MGNYHYIIAGLPELVLDADNKGFSYDAVRESIYSSSEDGDRRLIEWLDFGSDEDNLNSHFYRAAFRSRCRFIRLWFALDLEIRNRKVDFVAGKMERDGESYKVCPGCNGGLELSEEQLLSLQEIFANSNILEKEQLLDRFKWNFLTQMNGYGEFSMDVILCFLAKGKLIDRWNKLDRKTGEEMFRKLVDEVRGTFNGIGNKKID
ncbi:MAG: DUF2764 family protein [Bacteroidales bacterium]|nr:DUF2764 family protein [Bacteroidales bacterium]